MDMVRIGIIGVGNMGSSHSRYLLPGNVERCKLVAVCDVDPERASRSSRERI